MRRPWHRFGLLVVLAAVVLATVAPAGALDDDHPVEPGGEVEAIGDGEVAAVERVLVISLPTVRWSDVVEHRPPALVGLLEQSAVASMSVRTIGAVSLLARSYATIGAGNRATVSLGIAGLSFPPGSSFEGGDAFQVFERRCACAAEGAASVHVGIANISAANDRLLFGAVPGSLGEALRDAGKFAGAVGNADQSLAAVSEAIQRDVALAVMDTDGRMWRGAVGPQLLVDDPAAPFGVRADIDATLDALATAWGDSDLVVLEASDLERADRYAPWTTPAARTAAHATAMASADALVAGALDLVDLERDLVMVIGPTDPRPLPAELTIAAIAGPGFRPGLASSGTTRRDGYVTLPDVAPTILRALGVEVPSAMNGAPMTVAGDRQPSIDTFRSLSGDNDIAVFRNAVAGPISVAFIAIQVLTYLLAVAALTGGRRRLRPAVTFMALTTMAAPSVAFLSGLVPYDVLGQAGYVVAFFAASAVLAAVAWAVGRWVGRPSSRGGRIGAVVAPLLLAGLVLTVLLVDVASGGRLQIDTVFGYGGGPIVAGRFAGYGNLAFSLVAIAAIVVGTGMWGVLRLRRPASDTTAPHTTGDRLLLAGISVLFVVTVLAIGLPQLGLNVGGVLSSVPAFIVTMLILSGVALSWRRVALVGVASVGVIAAFGLLDLTRPEESRTHLGRFISLSADQGAEGFTTVIQRKVASNLNILTSSVWTLLIPVAVGFIAFLAWRQPGFLRRLHGWMPGTRACLVGGLVLAVLGGVLNDSGVAIPGILFAVLLPYLTVLILRTAEP
ncbi:MAG TPA: hypothetical protein VMN58_01440 [Acidimicrobiales bacterium]|nr:hypothetical protein [Acidimicrobiales bacterium]